MFSELFGKRNSDGRVVESFICVCFFIISTLQKARKVKREDGDPRGTTNEFFALR